MRQLLVLLIWVVTLLAVQGYMWFDQSMPRPEVRRLTRPQASGEFEIRLTLTFEAAGDAFEPRSVLLSRGDQLIFESRETHPAGATIVIKPVTALVEGQNELLLQIVGNPGSEETVRAARVEVWRDGHALAENSVWALLGEPVSGLIDLHIPASGRSESTEEH